MDRKLRPFNLGSGQFIFLLSLYNHDGVSQESLAKSLKFDKGTTAVAMKQLETRNYIVRETDSSDKRSLRINVTPKARAIEPDFMGIITSWTDILTKGFSEQEKATATDLLKRISENAAAALEEDAGRDAQ